MDFKNLFLPNIHNLISPGIVNPFCGFIIGVGGFNELSVLGMALWTILELQNRPPFQIGWRDVVVLSIGVLMFLYWSFPDPEIPQSLNGLTFPEIVKAVMWMIFSPLVLRCKPFDKARTFLLGIASGLAFYSGLTLIGSLLFQPFQGSYVHLFNIFTGELDAGSTQPGYVACGVLMILLRLNSRFLPAAIALTLGYVVQAQNRSAFLLLLFVIALLVWERRSFLLNKFRSNTAILITIMAFIVPLLSGISQFSFVKRFGDILKIGRAETHLVGFDRLFSAYYTADSSFLNQVPANLVIKDKWWHNILLDSLRNSGFLGHCLSLIWIAGLLFSCYYWYSRGEMLGCSVAIVCFAILWTSIPVGVGSYELISILTLTLLSLYCPAQSAFSAHI